MASKKCIDAVKAAAGDSLTDDEIVDVFETVQRFNRKLQGEGKHDRLDLRLKQMTAEEAERKTLAAAIQRKHARMSAIVKERELGHVRAMMAENPRMDARKALLARLEGTNRAVTGGRASVYAVSQGYETRFIGQMIAELERDVPHLRKMVTDKRLNDDIVREMAEITPGGRPGVTKNADAMRIAEILAKHAEISRRDLNDLGAMIGKLEGWAGPQRHDQAKIARTPVQDWRTFVKQHLDIERSFPDAIGDDARIDEILDTIHQDIATGRQPEGPKEGFVGPANVAKNLGRSRVLHFKNADAWISYRDRFGEGTVLSNMIDHQLFAARNAAQLQTFGPNPEHALKSVGAELGLQPTEFDAKTSTDPLRRLANALAEMQGLTRSPASASVAMISQDIRNVQSMAKLGGAVITALPTDTVTQALAGMFRGSGFVDTFVRSIEELLRGKSKTEAREITNLLGEGFDGLVGRIASPHYAGDGVLGHTGKMADMFFRWNGLTGWTDAARGAAGRVLARELATNASKAFDRLPDKFRHMLRLHGIGEADWAMIRQAKRKLSNGNEYLTPDMIADLSDDIADLKTRRDLELRVAAMIADEVNFAVVETDAASRRLVLQGTRPGSLGGEAIRFLAQFKSFPVAFAQRVLGRTFYGARNRRDAAVHFGTLFVTLGAAGYASMVMKDATRGQWPPRDPSDPKVLLAALAQGGALGIYGDFLFGEASRFDNSVTATVIGPTFGTVADLIEQAQAARAGEGSAARLLNTAINNTPAANLFYLRPALDALILDSAREWASPGYRQRKERRLKRDYGQELIF
ncbi:hypothetical protein AB1K42_14220 [Roseibium algicola]|uniref:hypothetical protein n=1 Tax=Roseibium algicola TaxID=2857014 RepID=UPI00345B0110